MGPQISLFLFLGFALLVLVLAVYNTIQLWREGQGTFEDAIFRINQIMEIMPKLHELEAKERKAECRRIAEYIREDCKLLSRIVYIASRNPKSEEAERLARAAMLQIRRVHMMNAGIFLLLRFRPALLRNCCRVTETARQHSKMWVAYFRLIRAQYPDELGNLAIPE